MGCYFHYRQCQEARPSLTDNEFMRGIKKSEQIQMRKEYTQKKGYKIIEMRECNWWDLYRTDATVKNHPRAKFLYQRSLGEERLMQEIKSRRLFGYVQCDLKVPEDLKAYFANFPPIFKNTVVCRNDIGDLMKDYAEKEGIVSQPRRMLISSFHLKNATIITPLLLYYLHLGLECTKIHQFVQYTPKRCFSSYVQSAVNARRQGDKNPNSSVVAETKKLLTNISYVYQIMDRSRHTVTKSLNDENTHSAINNKLLKQLNFITDQFYEVELVKPEIEDYTATLYPPRKSEYLQKRLTRLVNKMRDFLKIFDPANKCIQIPLRKPKVEIRCTKSKVNLFAHQYNDSIEHPIRQFRLSFRFGNNNSCVFSIRKIELPGNHFLLKEIHKLNRRQIRHLYKKIFYLANKC